jgi:hypothetical protein
MQLWGVTEEELAEIVKMVSEDNYAGNVVSGSYAGSTDGSRRINSKCIAFTLRVLDSRGPGHRLSASEYSRYADNSRAGIPGSRHRLTSACWHVHRDVMRKIFDFNPDARIKSAMADYRGVESFNAVHGYTGHHNSGSLMAPVAYADLCECDGNKTILPRERLEYLRQQIRNENISYGEISELQSLASHIDSSDVELLEWAGVPEKGEVNA